MTNLVFDFGNSFAKAAFVSHHKIISRHKIPTLELSRRWIDDIIRKRKFQKLTYVSVIELPGLISKQFENTTGYNSFSSKKMNALRNKYKSPRTLGSDRMAAALGSYSLFPSRNVLTIVCGTCITYNFVNKRNEYLGGAITPGLNMRLQAMHQFTGLLPLISLNKKANLVGMDTAKSMQSGALWGAVSEINGMIELYKKNYKSIMVVISGGDAALLQRRLKNRIFAAPDLVLNGLDYYLNLND